MVTHLDWSAKARRNLNQIFVYYKKKRGQAAVRLFNKILDEAETLLIFPEAGKIEPLGEDMQICYRSLVIEKHFKLIYYSKNDAIRIVAIWDCRRNPSSFKQFVGK